MVHRFRRKVYSGGLVALGLTASAWGTRRCSIDAEAPVCLGKIGVITDIQYADVDDTFNFHKTHTRRYRGALDALERAVDDWLGQGDVGTVLDLGDIIDQVNQKPGFSRIMLARVLASFDRLPRSTRICHLIGNHELYNFTLDEIKRLIPGVSGTTGKLYHSFVLSPGWRVVVLNSYDEHCITDREPQAGAEKAFQMLEKYNENDVRAPRGTVNWCAGLEGLEARFVPFNGAVGREQLEWLQGEVDLAVRSREKLLVFAHVPLYPDSCVPTTLAWNYDEVLAVLRRGTVAAVFAGHDHTGGYKRDAYGTHHITLPSPLHATPQSPEAHGTLEVYHDHLKLNGRGIVQSMTLPL